MENKLPAFVLFTFLHCVYSVVGVRIHTDVSELIIKKDSALTFNCSGDEPVRWTYPKASKTSNKKVENETEYGTYYSTLTINPAHYLDTGYYACQSENNTGDVAKIYIYCLDEKQPLVSSTSLVNAVMYDTAVIPCKPTSPNISVSLTRMGVEVEPIEKYDPKIGYVISTYPIVDSASFSCLSAEPKTSLRITLKVNPPQNASSNPYIEVTDSNFKYPIFEKQNATLNCSVITSTNMGIKSLEWEFPKNVEKKIIIENSTELRRNKFNGFFRILNIYNVTKNDEGNYTCKVIDENSNTKVSTHSLHIEELDSEFLNVTIPEKYRSVTVQTGQSSVEFIAYVEAFPKDKNTWYDPLGRKIGHSISTNDKYNIIEDERGTKLVINRVEIKDFGIYRLRVSNILTTKTINFTLIVEDKPGMVELKNTFSGLYKVNSTIFLECIVSGYPLPHITWSAKNCNNYPACENDTFQPIPTSQHEEKTLEAYKVTSTLRLKSNQSLIIRCEANNSLGSSNALSSILLTDYYGVGAVMQKNYSEPITVGDDIKLVCAVSKYRYFNNFTWDFQNKRIVSSQEIQLQNFTTTFSYVSTLSIANVQKNHSGRYNCKGYPKNSSNMLSFHNNDHVDLMVKEAKRPSIVQSNMNTGVLQVVPGTSVKILIQVDGSPSPVVVWYKNGKPLSFNNRTTLSNGYRNLTIANVSREDEGVYSFVASNKAGNVTDRLHLLIQGTTERNVYLKYFLGVSMFVFLLLAIVLFWFIRKLRKEKKNLQKILREYGLQGCKDSALPSLDPDLDIDEQTFLIPYNQNYEFPMEKLELDKVLGSGAFGIVRKAEAVGIIEKNVRTTVAVKVAKRQQYESVSVKALASELKIMIYLGKHPNVVNLLGACTKGLIKGELAVIVEYCKYGNLREFILKRRNNFVNQIKGNDEIDFTIKTPNCYENIPFKGENGTQSKNVLVEETPIGSDRYLISNELYEPEWRSNYLADYDDDVTIKPIKTYDLICWSYQAARGMEYLASRKILHGDLAARNILLAEGSIAKICDFGLAKSMYQSEEYQSSKTVFPVKWMAIESIRDRVFSTQSDVWSFGITMWEFFSLAVSPYPGLDHVTNLYEKLESGYRLEKPKFATDKIYNLMKDCWNRFPKLRPSFTELCEKLGCLLEDPISSRYVNLNGINESESSTDICDGENYLKVLGSPANCKNEDQIHPYVNIPSKTIHNPTYVEMKEIPENTNTS